jgi:hypothetical protein
MAWWNPLSWGRKRKRELTPFGLDQVNAARFHRKQRLLSMEQARDALGDREFNDDGFDFLVGLAGVPWPSPSGLAGYAISATRMEDLRGAVDRYREESAYPRSDPGSPVISGADSSGHNHRAHDSWSSSSHHTPSYGSSD